MINPQDTKTINCCICNIPNTDDWMGLCQMCWEAHCDSEWWKMIALIQELEANDHE